MWEDLLQFFFNLDFPLFALWWLNFQSSKFSHDEDEVPPPGSFFPSMKANQRSHDEPNRMKNKKDIRNSIKKKSVSQRWRFFKSNFPFNLRPIESSFVRRKEISWQICDILRILQRIFDVPFWNTLGWLIYCRITPERSSIPPEVKLRWRHVLHTTPNFLNKPTPTRLQYQNDTQHPSLNIELRAFQRSRETFHHCFVLTTRISTLNSISSLVVEAFSQPPKSSHASLVELSSAGMGKQHF